MAIEKYYLDLILRKLVSRHEPTQAQVDGARRSHLFLRAVLANGQFGYRLLDDYLTGSYARDTAIRPLDDVDIVFEFDPNVYSGFALWRPDVNQVLQSFARAIRYRYDNSRVEVQNRSVGLKLYHLDIDVVPAIRGAAEGHILVPDRTQ